MKSLTQNDTVFYENLNYILTTLSTNIAMSQKLEDKLYFEMSKNEIIHFLQTAYCIVITWEKDYKNHDLTKIIESYKNVESIISELELCLADYENIYHMDGISYALYQIGIILIAQRKEENN